MPFMRKYNTLLVTGTTSIRIPIIKRAVVDFALGADWTPAAGDVKVFVDAAAAANITNLPTAIASGNGAFWEFIITAAELTCKQLLVVVADAATKAIEDQSFIVETYGNASAMYAADLSLANLPANVTQLLGTAWLTPGVAGTPDVNTKLLGAAPVTATTSVTFSAASTVASTTNITAGTVTTATNVTTLNGIAANVITATSIAADAITAAKIADGAIDALTFASGAINAAAIATGAIDADALASDAVVEIRSLASGTSDSGTTTTMVDAARTEADTDYWAGQIIVFTSGTILGQARQITAFTPGTDTITFAPATTQAVGTQTYEIWPSDGALRPTVIGRTLDVSAGGEGGLDWANIGSPTTAQNLSATNIDVDQIVASVSGAVASVTTAVTVGAINANVITAASIAADAITDAKVAADVTIASVTGAVGSVTGAVGSVTGAVGSVTANVNAVLTNGAHGGAAATASFGGAGGITSTLTGSVTGSVGSVTGAVGSVTGAVGSVTGAVGSVTGAVGSVTGLTAANLDATISSRATPAQVKTQMTDALNVDTYAEPGQGTPLATTTLVGKIGYLFKNWRNRQTQTSTTWSLFNDDALTVDQKATVADDATTASKTEIATGP